MKTQRLKLALVALATAVPFATVAAPIVHSADFIADAARTNFVGFEPLTDRVVYNTTYTEDGISVQNAGDYLVWTENYIRKGFEGQRYWYPSGSYKGYNVITKQDGSDFQSIGMLVGSGFGGYCSDDWDSCDTVAPYLSLHYELREDGVVVASGTLAHHPNAHYLGFSGGGFDEVRVWDRNAFSDDNSALALDAIEVADAPASVPEPGTAALALAAFGAMGIARRRRS